MAFVPSLSCAPHMLILACLVEHVALQLSSTIALQLSSTIEAQYLKFLVLDPYVKYAE
jgi:hypothetical protein